MWQVQCCAAAAVPRHCERAGDLLGLRPLLLLRLLLGLRLLALAAGEPERAGDLDGERAGLLLRLLSLPRLLLLLRLLERLGV